MKFVSKFMKVVALVLVSVLFIGFAAYQCANWVYVTTSWDCDIVEEIYGELPVAGKVIMDLWDKYITIPLAEMCAMRHPEGFAGCEQSSYLEWLHSWELAMDNRFNFWSIAY